MVYLICFLAVLVMLLFLMGYGKSVNVYTVILTSVIAIGNGGYYALAMSTNLQEALLANKLTYIIAVFAPITIFMNICNICRIVVPKRISTILYSIQIVIYLCACTQGSQYKFFFKDVTFKVGPAGGYLEKVYGPVHTIYLITVLLYTVAGMVVGLYSLNRNTVVSKINVDTVIFIDILSVGVYLLERLIHLKIELMPISFTIAMGIMLIPLTKLSVYSVYNNRNIFEDEQEKTAYIIFTKKLKYMGSNECARNLFPELAEWELEEKIPGNGGRFNTFLRQPLNDYVKSGETVKTDGKTYKYKDLVCKYEIGSLLKSNNTIRGYYIKVSDVTDVVKDNVATGN